MSLALAVLAVGPHPLLWEQQLRAHTGPLGKDPGAKESMQGGCTPSCPRGSAELVTARSCRFENRFPLPPLPAGQAVALPHSWGGQRWGGEAGSLDGPLQLPLVLA